MGPSDTVEPPRVRGAGEPGTCTELPSTLHIAGVELSRTQSPPSLACWSGYLPGLPGSEPAGLNVVIEPAAPPDCATLRLAHDVASRFDELVDRAREYCRTRLREPGFGLTAGELGQLDLPTLPLAAPEATVWDEGGWAVRFAECGLGTADPYGVLVTFDGTRPVDLQVLDGSDGVDGLDGEA
ncbi:hypothetical protein [Streptomyces uncialis]|uniref:hypothetical protein n=1 Tax=Streptomyces uncialis TaxID=1048205 RepID=UPI00386A346F|nr:hypothetical protein OG268_16795 [Streptomyces uncialis]